MPPGLPSPAAQHSARIARDDHGRAGNTIPITPSSTGMLTSRRRTMKRITQACPSGALLAVALYIRRKGAGLAAGAPSGNLLRGAWSTPSGRDRCLARPHGPGGLRLPPHRPPPVVERTGPVRGGADSTHPTAPRREDDVVGIEGRTIVERDALTQVAGQLGQVRVAVARGRQAGIRCRPAHFEGVQRLRRLLAARSVSPSVSSAQYRPIGSAFCIQTIWSRPPDSSPRSTRCPAVTAPLDVRLPGGCRGTVNDRHHRNGPPDGVVGLA